MRTSYPAMTTQFEDHGKAGSTVSGRCAGSRSSIRLAWFFSVLVSVFGLFAGSANAVLTTLSYSPGGSSLSDLGKNNVYTWRLDNLPTDAVTAATLTFSNVKNWDANANKLFGHLLDSANSAGVDSFTDNPNSRTAMMDLTDDFANPRHHGNPDWLVAPGTGDTKLFGKSFTMTPTTWTYTFNQEELSKLNQYLADGSIAFGFDSDSHYFNEGITFNMMFTAPPPAASPIPEPTTVLPLAGVLLMAVVGQARARRRAETLAA